MKLPLTGLDKNMTSKALQKFFQKNYDSVVSVEIENDQKENIYGVVLFGNQA